MKLKKDKNPIIKGKCSAAATAGFLMLSILLVYACVRLTGNIVMRELGEQQLQEDAGYLYASPSPSSTPVSEQSQSAVAIYVPSEVSPEPSASSEPDLSDTPQPTETPQATSTPRPTIRPVFSPNTFNGENMDFVLMVFDAKKQADWVVAVSVRKGVCTALSIPRNTLCDDMVPLKKAGTPRTCLRMLKEVYPVQFQYYAELQEDGLWACIDAMEGIELDGKTCSGSQVKAYLENGGSDELLRIERQQIVMRACLDRLNHVNWIRLLSQKFKLQKLVGSNFGAAQILELYAFLRQTPKGNLKCSTLPVDSVQTQGERYYQPDFSLINRIAEQQFVS